MPSTRRGSLSSKKNTKRKEIVNNNPTKHNTKGLSHKKFLRDPDAKHEVRKGKRMFACKTCDRIWWIFVRGRKPVSECFECEQKYYAIPRCQEYGRCRYHCKKCQRKFSGFGSMGNPSTSPCYECGQPCYPKRVISPKRRKRTKSSSTHSCTGHNCFMGAQECATGICVHPQSNQRKVVVASKRHVSTGSTLGSILIQDDLDSDDSTRMELSDVEEEDKSE